MNKQKWLVAGLSLAMVASLGLGLSACSISKKTDPPVTEHTHTYDAWDHDDTQHWKYCDEHGTDKSNIDESTKAAHDFSKGDCECGAKKPAEHTHEYTKWQYSETQHWKVCPADDAVWPQGKVAHDFVEGECECGAKEGVKHTHEYTEWKHDETQHWKVCPTDGEIDPAGKADHNFVEGKCECGATEGAVTPAELDTREFYVVGGGAGDLKNGTWNGPDEKFKFTKAAEPDENGYTVYTFTLKVYSDDEFKFIEKNAITHGTDADGNQTTEWHDELVFTADDLDETAAKGVFKNVGGNIVVETGADGVYEFTLRTKKDGEIKENKISFTLKQKLDPLGILNQYDMYLVGKIAAKTGCKWPSEYPAGTMVADVAKYCYHLELQDDGETFSVQAKLATTDTFKVWNAKLANKDAGYYPTGMGTDLKVSKAGIYVVSWKAGASNVTISEHEHEYTAYAHDIQGTTQHWKVCSICGAKQEGSEEDHFYGADGTENCVCGVTPGWGDHVHDYTVWKKDIYGHQCWKVCADDNAIDPENDKALHDFDETGTCTRCGSKLADMIDLYLSAATKLPAEAYVDSIIIGQSTKSDAAPNNPHLTLDVATKTYSITMWLTKGEIWKPWAADQLATNGVYDRFNWLYRYDETAKAIRSVNNISLASGQESGVYTVSWVYNTANFIVTPVENHQHDFTDAKDETCNTCGYTTHFFSETWTQTPTQHYHASTCAHEGLQKDLGDHVFNGDNICDTCQYVRTTMVGLKFTAQGDDGYVVSGYDYIYDDTTVLEIPATYEEKPVIGIKDNALYVRTNSPFAKITEVKLPASLTSLGNYAFSGFAALKSIDLTHVTSIGIYAFQNCAALTSVTLPDAITEIPNSLFSGCTLLSEVNFNKAGVTKFGSYCFQKTALTSFSFADLPNITQVPIGMFDGCASLAEVTLSDKITVIGGYAFRSCTSLTTIEIPASVVEIGGSAFNKAGLTSATFKASSDWYLTTSRAKDITTGQPETNFADATTAAQDLVNSKVGTATPPKTGTGESLVFKRNAVEEHQHSYTEWKYDEAQHWKVCPDDQTEDPATRAAHVYDQEENTKCVCGKEKPETVVEYDVNWYIKGTDEPAHTQKVQEGNEIAEAEAYKPAAKTNYTFSGWYTDEDCTQAVEFPVTVNEAKNFYGEYRLVLDQREYFLVGSGQGTIKASSWESLGTKAPASCKFTRDPGTNTYRLNGFELMVGDEMKLGFANTWGNNDAYNFGAYFFSKYSDVFEKSSAWGANAKVADGKSGKYNITLVTQGANKSNTTKTEKQIVSFTFELVESYEVKTEDMGWYLTGSMNEWNTDAPNESYKLTDEDGDGVWEATITFTAACELKAVRFTKTTKGTTVSYASDWGWDGDNHKIEAAGTYKMSFNVSAKTLTHTAAAAAAFLQSMPNEIAMLPDGKNN